MKVEKIKIGDCCELKYGKALKGENRVGGKYPVYGSGGIVGYHNEYLVEKPTLIIGRKGSIGQIYLSDKPCWPIDTAYYLEYDARRIDLEWFRNLLLTSNLKNLDKSAAVPGLNRNDVYGLQAFIPHLQEQKRIANILSKAETLISQRKESIRLLDEFLKSTFLEMFGDLVTNDKGWIENTIDNVCDAIVDCVNRTAPIVDFVTEYKMIRTTNVRHYKINFQDLRYVSKETFERWTRRLVPQRGDIIFTREAPVGEAAIVDIDDKIFLGQRTMHFRPSTQKMKSECLLFQLMAADLKRQIDKLGSGSTVKHLSVPACKKFIVKVPPLELQNQFSLIVQKTEVLRARYQTSLQCLENLFESLSQRAFKGELNVKGAALLMPAEFGTP